MKKNEKKKIPIVNWMFWKSASFFPNCFLIFTCSIALVKESCAPPNEQDAMFTLPPSKPIIAIGNPPLSSPSLLETGTLQFSKITALINEGKKK